MSPDPENMHAVPVSWTGWRGSAWTLWGGWWQGAVLFEPPSASSPKCWLEYFHCRSHLTADRVFFFSLYFNLSRWALSPALCASRPSPVWRLHFSRLQTTYAMLTHAWPSTRDPRTSRSSSPLTSCEARPSSGSFFFFILCTGDLQLTAHAHHSCRKRHNNPLSSIGCWRGYVLCYI